MSTKRATNEMQVAEEIISVLPASIVRFCSDERDTLRFAVRSADFKLRSIVLRRSSLRKLADDPARAIKIEYLQRDLIRSAARRAEFRYPSVRRLFAAPKPAMLPLPIASVS